MKKTDRQRLVRQLAVIIVLFCLASGYSKDYYRYPSGIMEPSIVQKIDPSAEHTHRFHDADGEQAGNWREHYAGSHLNQSAWRMRKRSNALAKNWIAEEDRGKVKWVVFLTLLLVVMVLVRRTSNMWSIPLLNQFQHRGVAYEDIAYHRRVPMNHSIEQNLFALMNGGAYISPKDILNAYILRLMMVDAIVIEKEVKVGSFGELNEKISLALHRNTRIYDESTQELFDFLVSASGNNNILEPREMDAWISRNNDRLEHWYRRLGVRGELGFRKRNGFYVQREETRFGRTKGYRMTDTGRQLILEALGFKKYLEDFTLLAERETKEVELWDEYLVFAGLFGIAEQVSEEMRRIYPSYITGSLIPSKGFDLVASLHFSDHLSSKISRGLIHLENTANQGRNIKKAFGGRSGF